MTDHQVKLNSYWYNELSKGNKPWEIRLNDRGYKSGDWLIFFEFDEKGYNPKLYTGKGVACEVIAVYDSKYLPSREYVIMTIGHPEELADEYIAALATLVAKQDEVKMKYN